MKLMERLALIKAGYTKKEIAEIEQAENVKAEPEVEIDTEDNAESPTDTGSENEEETIDYKAEYDKLSEKIKSLETTLEQAQKGNVHKEIDIPEPKDPQEEIDRIVGNFL